MYYIGIDIGGTSIKAGLVDDAGGVHEAVRAPTIVDDLEGLISTITVLALDFQSGVRVEAIGIGIPGLLSRHTRKIETSPNIPCLQGVNVEILVAGRVNLPVASENDGNAGAYGEWVCGGGRGLHNVVYLTLGTGLGCGLVLDGKLFRGTSGYAAEFGHTTVEPGGRLCGCGAMGCLETRVSAPGMVETARECLRMHPASLLGDLECPLTAEAIYDAAVRGDVAALQVFEETGRFLGVACANLINLLNPEMILIGGGVMASGNLLIDAATAEIQRRAFAPSARDCTIVQSKLWPDAGLIGAAMLARDR